MFRAGIIFLVALGILAGCKTTEYKRAESDCRSQATTSHPPDYKIVTLEGTRLEKIPDGNISCTTISSRPDNTTPPQTVCDQGTRTIEIPYKKDVKIDLNKEARERAVAACVERTCGSKGADTCPKYIWSTASNLEKKRRDWSACLGALSPDRKSWRNRGYRIKRYIEKAKSRGFDLKDCQKLLSGRRYGADWSTGVPPKATRCSYKDRMTVVVDNYKLCPLPEDAPPRPR